MKKKSNIEFIAHRINTIQELKDLPRDLGLELDIRDFEDNLILQHDPYKKGESLEKFLEEYKNRGTLILNIKSERIEHKVLELIRKYKIERYFFLDSSFPMIHLLSNQGEKKIALRFSEWEGIDTISAMRGRVDWVWVDCFTKLPLTKKIESELHNWGYKICLVSPELQGREKELEIYRDYLMEQSILVDAVCSKVHNLKNWNL